MTNEQIEISQGDWDILRIQRDGPKTITSSVSTEYIIQLYRDGWRPVKETKVGRRTVSIYEKRGI